MSIERVFPQNAPTPRGPYSPVVRAGDFIYVSGQGPIDPITDKLAPGDIQFQTRLVLSNIKRILESCGASFADVVRCGVFLKDGSEFKAMNEVYAEFFGDSLRGPPSSASSSLRTCASRSIAWPINRKWPQPKLPLAPPNGLGCRGASERPRRRFSSVVTRRNPP